MQKVITIQYCKDCLRHRWNTRHDQTRYATCFRQFEKSLGKQGILVRPSVNNRLGSFQISYENYTLFSKRKQGIFPDVNSVTKFIIKFLADLQTSKEKYTHLIVNKEKTIERISSKTIDANPGFSRVSMFSSPNKYAKTVLEIFNASKELSNYLNTSRMSKSKSNTLNLSFRVKTTTKTNRLHSAYKPKNQMQNPQTTHSILINTKENLMEAQKNILKTENFKNHTQNQ